MDVISEYSLFEFVCAIIPEVDNSSQIQEFTPFEYYDNINDLKLHKYGTGPFCKFKIPLEAKGKTGIYIIKVNDKVKYVGECEDLANRYNAGYGNISPRNCFKGGQPTNCKININILNAVKCGYTVELYFLKTTERFKVEQEMIEYYKPEWNSTKGKSMKQYETKNEKSTVLKSQTIIKSKWGKYLGLKHYLEALNTSSIELTFTEIESIIKDILPDSARKYSAWWANGGHSQADSWMDAGWLVTEIKLDRYIRFTKKI